MTRIDLGQQNQVTTVTHSPSLSFDNKEQLRIREKASCFLGLGHLNVVIRRISIKLPDIKIRPDKRTLRMDCKTRHRPARVSVKDISQTQPIVPSTLPTNLNTTTESRVEKVNAQSKR
ncbi:hypothetical protein ED733_006302 [Metarhizium rileyi]|uniref:Uncharacterized protein n=1 Tax=Metarhizium rileyi (strain RCEF 4871) TaxID=1649241 RepID=A0A5C6G9X7_METRR|nr:hypothetical protein ED733_006302 [Metarhizium rileyi]